MATSETENAAAQSMMPQAQAIVAEVTALASRRGWDSIRELGRKFQAADARSLLLLAADGVDIAQLAQWAAVTAPGIQAAGLSLEALGDDPGMALTSSRVAVVFRCGQLLTPTAAEVVGQLLTRPPGSFTVLFVEAEMITDADDLAQLERGFRRVLIGGPEAGAADRGLAEFHCLLWSQARLDEPVAGRVTRDTGLLAEWLRGSVTWQEELDRQRAALAVGLAEDAVAAQAATAVPTAGHEADVARLKSARHAIEEGRERVLRQMDTAASLTIREAAESLQSLEQDLLPDVAVYLRARGWPKGQRLSEAVTDFIGQKMDGWRAGARAAIARRLGQLSTDVQDLLGEVEWSWVNQTMTPSGVVFPPALLAHLRWGDALVLPGADTTAVAVRAADQAATRGGSLARLATTGGALGAGTAAVLGLELAPIIAAGAAGFVGGSLLGRYLDGNEEQRAAELYARSLISTVITAVLTATQQQLRDAASEARRAVRRNFQEIADSLTAALHRAATEQPEPSTAGSVLAADPDADALADLRRRFAALSQL